MNGTTEATNIERARCGHCSRAIAWPRVATTCEHCDADLLAPRRYTNAQGVALIDSTGYRLTRVRATTVVGKGCNRTCWAATSATCRCECGGAAHGTI